MKDIIEKLNRISLTEALTPEEQKELDTLAAKFSKADMLSQDPDVSAALKDYQALKGQTTQGAQTAGAKPAGGKYTFDPKVQEVQKKLIALGVDVGPTGADGKLGPNTAGGIRAFEKMAGLPETGKLSPELDAALAKGKAVEKGSDLGQSLSAIERIALKYKVESVKRSGSNLSEAERMAELRDRLDELGPLAGLAARGLVAGGGALAKGLGSAWKGLANKFGSTAASTKMYQGTALAKPGMSTLGKIGTAATVGGIAAPFMMGGDKPEQGAQASQDGSNTEQGASQSGSPAGVTIDPKDLELLQKHMTVVQKYIDDPSLELPNDIQARLIALTPKLQKLQAMAEKATPKSPEAPQAQQAAQAAQSQKPTQPGLAQQAGNLAGSAIGSVAQSVKDIGTGVQSGYASATNPAAKK